MAFWSGEKLASRGRALDVVEPFDEKRIDCSAYQLSLGDECFVTPGYGDPEVSRKQRLEEVRSVRILGKDYDLTGGEMVIPAGKFAFLLTKEYVKIPPNAMGFISLKSGLKWRGLINVSGFHVDPGFHGRLVYSVYNAGPASIHLTRNSPLFLLWIADLDRVSAEPFIKPEPKLPLSEIPSDIISDIDRPLHSLQSLSERVEDLQRKLTLIAGVLTALGVIAGLVFAAWALLPGDASRSEQAAAVDVS